MTTTNKRILTGMISLMIAMGTVFSTTEAAEARARHATTHGARKHKRTAKTAPRKVVAKPVVAEPDPTRIIAWTPVRQDEKTKTKYVALTFDDGPSPEYTPQVLKMLKENNIHAVFCLVGRQVKRYPELVREIVAEGHKVADHSMNHCETLTRCTDAKVKQEILGDKDLIESVVPGVPIEYYRAPGGDWNHRVRAFAVSCGMKPLGWSVDTKDWQTPGEEAIVKTVKERVRPGAVILMHDAGGDRSQSIAALKEIIPALKKQGYEFSFPAGS